MKNYNHDLVQQLSEKLDSIWRYNDYIKNAESDGCNHCVELWKQLKAQDEKLVGMIRDEVKSHVEENKFE